MEVKPLILSFLMSITLLLSGSAVEANKESKKPATTKSLSKSKAKSSKKRSSKTERKPKIQEAPAIESAELKVLLKDTSIEPFLSWIKTVDSDFEQKRVFFFDTKNLDLYKQGVILRIRRMHDETYDSAAKLRSDQIKELPVVSRKGGKLDCELDVAYSGPRIQTCILTQKSKKILPSVDTERVDTYFNRDQVQFAKSKYPEMKWKEISILGPIISTEWETNQQGMDIVCELWTLPNKKRYLECSTLTPVNDLATAETKLISFLKEKKFQISESNQYKTDIAIPELR